MELVARPDSRDHSAADRVCEELKAAILSLELKPGQLLQERQIAQATGVSRTPVREALQRLERDGLVKIVPRVGAYVVPISFDDVREIYQLRILLESTAVTWAINRLDPNELRAIEALLLAMPDESLSPTQRQELAQLDFRFHELILTAAGNSRLLSIVRNLNAQGFRVRYLAVEHHPEHTRQDILRMIRVLLEGDAQQASQLMRDHILWSVQYLQNLVAQ